MKPPRGCYHLLGCARRLLVDQLAPLLGTQHAPELLQASDVQGGDGVLERPSVFWEQPVLEQALTEQRRRRRLVVGHFGFGGGVLNKRVSAAATELHMQTSPFALTSQTQKQFHAHDHSQGLVGEAIHRVTFRAAALTR